MLRFDGAIATTHSPTRPAFFFFSAVSKQSVKAERETKNVARAKELAASRAQREQAKIAAQQQAAVDRKEKQEGIAKRIEVCVCVHIEPPNKPNLDKNLYNLIDDGNTWQVISRF